MKEVKYTGVKLEACEGIVLPEGKPEPHWIADCRNGAQSDSNAAELVRRWNAFEEMLEALKAFEKTFPTTLVGLRDFSVVDLQDAIKLARAAISKVEGKA